MSDDHKLTAMLTNPALAKVVFLNCDVFSLGKIRRKDGETDDFIEALKQPNPFQTQRQWLWSYRFWLMFGSSYLKPTSTRLDSDRLYMYWLNSSCLDWNDDKFDKLDKLVFSKTLTNELGNLTVDYQYNDGKTKTFKLSELIAFHDLTNNTGNWYKGQSRIDAIAKILCNVDQGLDAKNINLEFSRKFLVGGNYDPAKNLADLGTMHDIEKDDIQSKLRGGEDVLPNKAAIQINRFIDDLSNMNFDDNYDSDLVKIGGIFNVPKELLDNLKEGGNTFENQDRALSRHISYSESPKGMDLIEGLANHFSKNPEDYEMSWDHLPAMQKDSKTEAEVSEKNAKTLGALVDNGADVNAAAELLGIDLVFTTPEPVDEEIIIEE